MDDGNCNKDHYSTIDLLTEVLKIDIRGVNKSHEMKLSNAMQKLGWTRQRKRVEGYRTARPYLYIAPKWAIDKRKFGRSASNVEEVNF